MLDLFTHTQGLYEYTRHPTGEKLPIPDTQDNIQVYGINKVSDTFYRWHTHRISYVKKSLFHIVSNNSLLYDGC